MSVEPMPAIGRTPERTTGGASKQLGWNSVRGFSEDVWLHPINHEARRISRLVCIPLPVEVGRGQILGAPEGEFAVSSQSARSRRKLLNVAGQACRQPTPLRLQNLGNIVHSWRVNSNGAQQPFQGKFDDLL